MGELIQVKADEDGCVYIYNVDTEIWQKLSNVKSIEDLPNSVKTKVQRMQRSTVQ